MADMPCLACMGSGQVEYPHAAYDGRGEPIIEHIIQTCIVCSGNGRVDDGS